VKDWQIFTGDGVPSDRIENRPDAPSWRRFGARDLKDQDLQDEYPDQDQKLAPLRDEQAIMMVNAALVLRRPLLVSGPPGSGKSTLAKLVARELKLGEVLSWPITTSSRLQDGLYDYDAIGRVHDENNDRRQGRNNDRGDGENSGDSRGPDRTFDIGNYITLGPLGTALLPRDKPRVLLIDEFDKSDLDLPSNLLHAFEEGKFTIRELARQRFPEGGMVRVQTVDNRTAEVPSNGVIRCTEFPFVVLTSNSERTFPKPFLRRCLRLQLRQPEREQLIDIVTARIGAPGDPESEVSKLVERYFAGVRANKSVTTDQLLNAVFAAFSCRFPDSSTHDDAINHLLEELTEAQ
jgi:MoxR-like ATPase